MRLSLHDGQQPLDRVERARLERCIRLVLGPSTFHIAELRAEIRVAPARGSHAPLWRCSLDARSKTGMRFEVADAGIALDDAVRAAAWRLARRTRRADGASQLPTRDAAARAVRDEPGPL